MKPDKEHLTGEFIKVIAEVRYWEDAEVNGQEDTEDGSNIPCKNGSLWEPIIRISDGKIMNWKSGVTASIHYKVCDQGTYSLLDDKMNKSAELLGYYVPEFLSIGDNGYGDYIILNIGDAGFIKDWNPPTIEDDEWCFKKDEWRN